MTPNEVQAKILSLLAAGGVRTTFVGPLLIDSPVELAPNSFLLLLGAVRSSVNILTLYAHAPQINHLVDIDLPALTPNGALPATGVNTVDDLAVAILRDASPALKATLYWLLVKGEKLTLETAHAIRRQAGLTQ